MYNFRTIGINTSQQKAVSAELKVSGNTPFDFTTLELNAFYNFKEHTYHQFSLGLGLIASPFLETDNLPLGLRVPLQLSLFPLQEHKQFVMIFELAPLFDLSEDSPSGFNFSDSLQAAWGIRYYFRKGN